MGTCDEAYIVLLGQMPDKAVHYPLPSVFHFHWVYYAKKKEVTEAYRKFE